MFFSLYPYTDFHELNLDYLLRKMKELEGQLEIIKQEAIEAATENAKAYVDEQLGGFLAEFDALKLQFAAVSNQVSTLTESFNSFVTYVDNEIIGIKATLDADIQSVIASTDQKINNAKDEIYTNLATELSKIKVINFFTGEQISVQDMFNYLAMLHVSDSIDYDTMALRAKTYSQLVALNINYTNLAMHGNTLYV